MSYYEGLMLRAPGNVARAIAVDCPTCRERAGTACRLVAGKIPEVHADRESAGYHRRKELT